MFYRVPVLRKKEEPPITGSLAERIRELLLRTESKVKAKLKEETEKRARPVLTINPEEKRLKHEVQKDEGALTMEVLQKFLQEEEPYKCWVLVPFRMGSIFDLLTVYAYREKVPVVCLMKEAFLSYLRKKVEKSEKRLPSWFKKELLALIELEKLYNEVQAKYMITEHFSDWEFITEAETAKKARKSVLKVLMEKPEIKKLTTHRSPRATKLNPEISSLG